jgi:hypothetical protein
LERHKLILLLFALAVTLSASLTGCRAVIPVSQIRPSSAPDISRVTLKNGMIVEFDRDFGWYNKQARTVEGNTKAGTHVEYNLTEIVRLEYVRFYSIVFAAAVATAVGAVAIYLLAKLFTVI